MTAHVYHCYDATGRLIYVGCTKNFEQRMGAHRAHSWWYGLLARVESEEFPSLAAGLVAEAAAIRTEQPAFNFVHRGPVKGPVTDSDVQVMRAWTTAKRWQPDRTGALPMPLRRLVRLAATS